MYYLYDADRQPEIELCVFVTSIETRKIKKYSNATKNELMMKVKHIAKLSQSLAIFTFFSFHYMLQFYFMLLVMLGLNLGLYNFGELLVETSVARGLWLVFRSAARSDLIAPSSRLDHISRTFAAERIMIFNRIINQIHQRTRTRSSHISRSGFPSSVRRAS